MDRREFLTSAAALASCGGCRWLSSGFEYSVVLLGDTHFDGSDSSMYHSGWKPRHASDLRDRKAEFARNAEMWKSRLPRLIASAAQCRPDNAVALFHVGDMIQGDTVSPEMQYRMLVDADRACRKGMEDLPFHLACGNHDIRNGGSVGFDRYLPQSNRLVNIGSDAYVFLDFMRPDVDRIGSLLKETDGARHTFVVSHGLCSPTDGWGYYWFLLGKKKDTEARRWFRHELARRNAIFIGGHIHRTAMMEWQLPEGRITQFVANSVWNDPSQDPTKYIYSDPNQFGSYERKHPTPMGQDHDGCHQNRTHAEALALFDEYREHLVRYQVIAAAGHYQLHVSDKVAVDFFPGDSRKSLCDFTLR